MPDILPDSRAKGTVGNIMVDWPMPGGRTVRIEATKVYCANCGTEFGYVPKENTTFAFWLCGQCFETYGAIAGTCVEPDEEFCRKVEAEMMERFGNVLSEDEIIRLIDEGRLGTALEKLARESPFPSHDHRAKG